MSAPGDDQSQKIHGEEDPVLVLKYAIRELETAVQMAQTAGLHQLTEKLNDALFAARIELRNISKTRSAN